MKSSFFNPKEPIKGLSQHKICDFWQWGYSNLIDNRNRAIFAEFIVGSVLSAVNRSRIEWMAYDFEYKGKKIEVKATAYLQNWKQRQLSYISFEIAKKRPWDFDSNIYGTKPIRSADCYVFCLFTAQNRDEADILDMKQWVFYVVLTDKIEKNFGEQKSISLSKVQKISAPIAIDQLKYDIDRELGFYNN